MRIQKDLVSFVLLALFAVVNQWVLIPTQVLAEGSSDVYPYMLNLALAVLLICYAVEIVRARKAGGKTLGIWNTNVAELGKIVALLALIWVWAIALAHFGFIMPTAVFLILSAWLYGERILKKIGMLALITPVVLFVFFTLLGAVLPQGPLEHGLAALLL